MTELQQDEDYKAGWEAFYNTQNARILPNYMNLPKEPIAYERYMRDRRFNEGWAAAKRDYTLQTSGKVDAQKYYSPRKEQQ